MAIAGHVSPRMLARYSHVRLEAKRNALDTLSRLDPHRHLSKAEVCNSGDVQAGCVTNDVTDENEAGPVPVELLEKNGRHEETRTPDLYRVKAHLFSPLNHLSRRNGPPKPLEILARRRFDGLENGLEYY